MPTEKLLPLLIERAKQWEGMRPSNSRTNFWDLRVNHVFMDWHRAGRPGSASLADTPQAWLMTVEPGREPQLEPPRLAAPPDPLPSCVFDGRLEIDIERGVIYFHDGATGRTVLRVGGLHSDSLRRVFEKKSSTSCVDMCLNRGANYSG